MIYVGIDPGITGAVAVIDANRAISFYDTPTFELKSNGKTKNVPDQYAFADILRDIVAGGPTLVVIEKVWAMPGKGGFGRQSMGATSAFNFGMGFGLWLGVIAALKIPVQQVAPTTWKKSMMSDMDKDKDASRIRAIALFPQVADSLKLKKHHGRADALLIADWGRRTNHYP